MEVFGRRWGKWVRVVKRVLGMGGGWDKEVGGIWLMKCDVEKGG